MKLRAGIRVLLVLALVLFALVVGIGSAVLEIATITRVEVDSAVNRAELAGHIVISQLAITFRDSTRTPVEAMRKDDRLATVIADAQELTPAVRYVMVADTLDQVLIHSEPRYEGAVAPPRPALERVQGLPDNLRQFLSILKETGSYEVSIPFLLDGHDFATVRVGIAALFLRSDLLNIFKTHLFTIIAQVVLATVLGFLASWLIILRPLARIEKGIRHLQKGDFTYRVPVKSGNEFDQLGAQLNTLSEMLAQEQEKFASLRDSLVSEGNALRSIVNAVEDGLLMIDRNRQIIMTNERASRVLGVKLSENIGKPLNSALARNHPLVRLVEKSFSENRPESAQIELKAADGAHVYLATCQVIGEAPNQQGGIISLREYGRMREIQEMLDHARVLARLGRMAAGVAHEVRNPLNALVLHVELIRTKLQMEDAGARNGSQNLKEHLNVVSREISRLERVVSGFLNLTRLQELQLTAIDVSTFLNEIRTLVIPEARMAGIDIVLDVEKDIPHIYGDDRVLRQALLNLVRNAIQASPQGSKPIRLSAESDGGVVELLVVDHGQGIPLEEQGRVFDLYYTTKKEGTGVGLAQAQQAIEMHGGSISLQSNPETGTVFTIRLPALATV